jgi:hypothetical protein
MVVALMNNTKTETRRLKGLEAINMFPDKFDFVGKYNDRKDEPGLHFTFSTDRLTEDEFGKVCDKYNYPSYTIKCPFGQHLDLLWVRETWCRDLEVEDWFLYRATEPNAEDYDGGSPWKPSIHMPKDAARIWLLVDDITVERLQNISEHSATCEGIELVKPAVFPEGPEYKDYTEGSTTVLPPFWSFNSLWCKIHGSESWEANPWVWVIKFKVISTTGKPQLKKELEVANG